MNLNQLTALLFPPDEFFGVRPHSQTHEWDPRPRLLPLSCLPIIQELDPTKNQFNIHIYKDRIEVWMLKEWSQSSSFHDTLRGTAEQQMKKQIISATLEAKLRNRLGLVDESIIKSLAASIRAGTCPAQVVSLFKLTDIINEYTSQTSNSGSADKK